MSTPTLAVDPVNIDTRLFLLTKPALRLRTESVCRAGERVDLGRDAGSGPCTRPVWGDGTVNGERFDMCSKCWHQWACFHSHYRLMQANPAAAAITDSGLERLYVDRKLDPVDSVTPAPDLEAAFAAELIEDPHPPTPYVMMERTVGDYAGTEYAPLWADLDDDHPVAVAYDPASTFYCALAVNAGQSVELAMWEAGRRLRDHIAGHTA